MSPPLQKEASVMGKTERTRPEIPAEVSLRVRDPYISGAHDSSTLKHMYKRKFGVYTQEDDTKAWSDAAEMVQTYSDEMVKRWKEEIDTYLVFVRRPHLRSHKLISLSKKLSHRRVCSPPSSLRSMCNRTFFSSPQRQTPPSLYCNKYPHSLRAS